VRDLLVGSSAVFSNGNVADECEDSVRAVEGFKVRARKPS